MKITLKIALLHGCKKPRIAFNHLFLLVNIFATDIVLIGGVMFLLFKTHNQRFYASV